MKLTKNFTLEEMCASSTAKAKGINNTPSENEEINLRELCKILQVIRDAWDAPVVVSSGYRCDKLNKLVGGAKNSDHRYGCAADIKTKEDTVEMNRKLFNLIIALKDQGIIKCRQIIDEYNYDWIHVSINNEHNQYKNNQVLHLK